MLITIALFLFILGLLVFVHEFGHFWVAKRLGVTVHEFAFGFRPRLFAWHRNGTDYAINLLPLGGYVRLEGEDEESHKPGSFANKPAWVKALILVAGVTMNIVLAWFVLFLAYTIGSSALSPTFANQPFVHVNAQVFVDTVEPNTPAAAAGLKSGDQLLAINGQTMATADDFVNVTKQDVGKPITIKLERDSQTLNVMATPRVNPPAGQGALGISLAESATVRVPWYQAPISAASEVGSEIKLTFVGLWQFFRDLVVAHQVSPDVSGIVGVGVATGIVRRLGVGSVLQFISLISVNLALINILPIAPLDGGQLLFVILEKVSKRTLDQVKNWASVAGLAVLLLFAIFITYKDVIRFDVISRIVHLF
jgi:regulator of sigma E protease